jgi:hypothetical protein
VWEAASEGDTLPPGKYRKGYQAWHWKTEMRMVRQLLRR